MTTIIDIPLNTMVADLDAALRRLLEPELARHGFGGVTVCFDAPTRDWAATLSSPTVNLFLYDLCEASEQRSVEWQPLRIDGALREVRPPLRLATSYAVTAWTRAVEDEHRLLSQVIGILYAHPVLPAEVLDGTLAAVAEDDPPETALAQPRADRRNDFWTAVGGQYKPSVDYAVVLPVPSGRALARGPEVRSRRLLAQLDAPVAVEERDLVGGRVRAADGSPAADCWVAIAEQGRVTVTDAEGRFRLDGLTPGRHRCRARGADGGTTEADLVVPGPPADLTLR